MEGLFTLLILGIVMAVTFALSPSQLRFISSLGMGVLVGTALIVIIPEGIETLYSSDIHRIQKSLHARALDVRWQHQDTHAILPRTVPSVADLNAMPGPVIPEVPSMPASPPSTPTQPEEVHILGSDVGHTELQEHKARDEDSESDTHEHEHEDNERSLHAWIGVALISGFILMYLIDKLPGFASPSKQKRPPYHISLDNLGSGLRRSASPSRDGGLLEPDSPSSRSHSFATTTGLVIHAAADGIALGASGSNTNLSFIIFLALLVHKAPASFGLTSVLLKQGLSSRSARAHLLVFSLAAPVGALLTFVFVQTVGSGLAGDEVATRWRTGMLLLFSAGTFLYVAMHTMQENAPRPSSYDSYSNGYAESRDTQRPKGSMRDLIASIIGMLLPLFLQIGHAH
ncbi:ZIP metal ion transporter [Rasamsonia emersonii CBS 393.64]|uniref:ZIP metal ion transporter n=1 Tax=Rasamsonia emersonii (strain ATCC 16479 / CBS 393.64 / IMI 116815) TaxID=1408163 RepID=A0A0F4YFX1_RASE3|nr:ZIP metal ion transporter [Rasamsonia emersonii CBS 393.64]KKA16841.1 ZIP metal ion transporter [Rasamsonia emersonii CBS 393.64]